MTRSYNTIIKALELGWVLLCNNEITTIITKENGKAVFVAIHPDENKLPVYIGRGFSLNEVLFAIDELSDESYNHAVNFVTKCQEKEKNETKI